jgi:DNA primase
MDQVAEIKQKLDIVDVVNSYVTLKKSGRNYKAVCPFHGEKTPSFMVSQELQIYKCFGCGVAGDIFNFVEAIEGVDFPRALEILADRAGVKLVRSEEVDIQSQVKKTIYSINELSTQFYRYILLKQKTDKKALDYLTKERKLTEETIRDFKIGYAPDSWDTLYRFLNSKKIKIEDMVNAGVIIKRASGSGYVDKFRGRIVFPLIGVDGRIVGFTGRTLFDREPKYLNTGDSPVFHKSFFLYGLDKSRVTLKKEGAVFVEGQMDLISAYQNGVTNVVCVSGTALTDSQLVMLSRYTEDITFCFDSDFAGVEASYRAIEMAGNRNFNVKVAVLPDEYKDIDDFLKADKESAKKMLTNAVPVYDYFLVTTLKKHNKTTALGKKAITEEIVPLFSKISNQVLLDHYAKKLASELDLSEDTVFSMIKKGTVNEEEYEEVKEADQKFPVEKQQTEGYLISLVLKSPIDVAKQYVKKLKKGDFLNEELGEIFEELSDYYDGRKSDINIKTLVNRFDEKKGNLVTELYMWDLEGKDALDEKELEKELDSMIDRIKKNSVKRQLKILSEEIRIAETEKDEGEIERLSKKFEKLSKGLL